MQINQTQNNPNFTSVIKAQIYIDGKRSLSTGNIRRAIREVQSVLTNPANGDQKLVGIKKEFAKYVKDFNYFGEKLKYIGNVIRNVVDEKIGVGYLFTGEQAKVLDDVGKKIGPQKHKALEILGTTDSFETSVSTKGYFSKVLDFINIQKLRVKEFVNPQDNSYKGDEMVLNIYTKSKGTPGKKGFKVELENIRFENLNKKVIILTPSKQKLNKAKKPPKDNGPQLPFDK